ncbi:MAG TPA: lipid II flippase MurJ [Candidatus Saccharimonadia bacterium]|nr:lipid II flippase MurJ [Candidatus Saccharimonadia bacterium]
MNKLIKYANRYVGISNITMLLIGSSLVAQLLGIIRTKLVNANFPALGPNSTDAYFAAFNIPDFFFYTLAAGALGVAFIPVITDHFAKKDKKAAYELTTSILNLFAIVTFVAGVIIFIFAKQLVHSIVAPGLTPHQLNNTVIIMRLIAFNPLLFTLSGVLTSMQQSIGRFFFFAMGPILYNLSIIVSIFVFRGNVGLVGLGIGALVGGVLQLGIIALGLIDLDFHWTKKIFWRRKDFQTVMTNFPARAVGLGVNQVEGIVETHFAAGLGTGNISYYNNANILQNAPVFLIGSAISTAVFPRLSKRMSIGRPDLMRIDFLRYLRIMIWMILPVTVICFFARGYLAHLIFARDSKQIASVFGFMAGAIVFSTIYTLISRWFFAKKDTMTPLYVSLFVIILNVILAYELSRPSVYGVEGLALAQSIVAALEVIILFSIMIVKDRKLINVNFIVGLIRIISVTGFTALTAYLMVSLFPLQLSDNGFLILGSKLGIITIVALFVHISLSRVFGLDELKPVTTKFKQIASKAFRTSS